MTNLQLRVKLKIVTREERVARLKRMGIDDDLPEAVEFELREVHYLYIYDANGLSEYLSENFLHLDFYPPIAILETKQVEILNQIDLSKEDWIITLSPASIESDGQQVEKFDNMLFELITKKQ